MQPPGQPGGFALGVRSANAHASLSLGTGEESKPCYRTSSRIARSNPSKVSGYIRSPINCFMMRIE
jgi:hypothetical protein